MTVMNDGSSGAAASTQPWDKSELFCNDLPTGFQPQLGRILVTGASGYIGGRLVPELLARGYKVRVMVRTALPQYTLSWPGAEIVLADAHDMDSLKTALEGIDTAYYLIHSLRLGPKKFERADIDAARNFRKAAEENRIKRIIYLGGLGDVRGSLSSHLRNRAEVAEELKRAGTPVTVLRAAVIVGSGSASYEIIQNLVRKLPVMLVPHWAKNRCQPIAVRDVIKYLVGVLETPETIGRSFDIGGEDVLTYEMMLKVLSRLLQKKTIFLPSPFSNTRLYAYITSLITPVPDSITKCLIEGLKNEVICQDDTIRNLIPFKTLSYKKAIVKAMTREEQDKVYTRWSDASIQTDELALKLSELKKGPAYVASYSLTTPKSAQSLFGSICRIGGKKGWFHSNWMWRSRGMIDRILLGIGTIRGRKSYSSLKINDVIDFWRIEDLQKDRRLLMRAEMRLPGRAWLEFNVTEEGGHRRLDVTAYYDTQGIFGRLYWYACLPFHHFIFHNLIREIEKRSQI